MKSILFKSAIISAALFLCAFTISEIPSHEVDVTGTWSYDVPYAPEGYQKGEFTFEKKDKKLSGYASIDGYKIPMEKVSQSHAKVTFGMSVEGNQVDFQLDFEKETFSGKASYSEGVLDITGKKK